MEIFIDLFGLQTLHCSTPSKNILFGQYSTFLGYVTSVHKGQINQKCHFQPFSGQFLQDFNYKGSFHHLQASFYVLPSHVTFEH